MQRNYSNIEHHTVINLIYVFTYVIAIFPAFLLLGLQKILGATLYQMWQIVGMGLLLVMMCINNCIKLDRYTVCFMLYQIQVFIVTTIKGGLLLGLLVTTVTVCCLINLIQVDRLNILYALSAILIVSATINFVTMLIEGTGGFHKEYFIGGKNSLSTFLLPGIYIVFLLREEIYLQRRKCSIRYSIRKIMVVEQLLYGYIFLAIFSVIYSGSGTGIMVGMIAVLSIILLNKINIDKKYPFIFFAICYGIIFCNKVVFSSSLWYDFTRSLGKDPTLTYRTIVWEGAINIFTKNPIVGKGRLFKLPYVDEFGIYNIVEEAHNMLLQILCDGGLLGGILYGNALANSIGRLKMKIKNQKILFFAFMIILFNGLTEAVNYQLLVILIPALANSYVDDGMVNSL